MTHEFDLAGHPWHQDLAAPTLMLELADHLSSLVPLASLRRR